MVTSAFIRYVSGYDVVAKSDRSSSLWSRRKRMLMSVLKRWPVRLPGRALGGGWPSRKGMSLWIGEALPMVDGLHIASVKTRANDFLMRTYLLSKPYDLAQDPLRAVTIRIIEDTIRLEKDGLYLTHLACRFSDIVV